MECPIHRHVGITRNGQLVGMILVQDLGIFLAYRPRK